MRTRFQTSGTAKPPDVQPEVLREVDEAALAKSLILVAEEGLEPPTRGL